MTTPNIFCLIAFRDEESYLPGLFSHLRDYVDGFVALDDCSTDASLAIAEAEPKMLSLVQRQIPSSEHHFEIQNRYALLTSAHEMGAHWVLCCDADERFETRFLEHLRELIQKPPSPVLGLRLVAMWENLQQHRVGNAHKFVLFPCVKLHTYYRPGLLHQQWYPPCFAESSKILLDYYIYHLGSLTKSDRAARYEKFNRIDPERKHQPQGYNNIVDESDLVVTPIIPSRAFRFD